MRETDLDENLIARTDEGILFSIKCPYIHVTKDLAGSRARSVGTHPSAIRTFARKNKRHRRIRQKISFLIPLPFIAIDRHLIPCLILQIIVLAWALIQWNALILNLVVNCAIRTDTTRCAFLVLCVALRHAGSGILTCPRTRRDTFCVDGIGCWTFFRYNNR